MRTVQPARVAWRERRMAMERLGGRSTVLGRRRRFWPRSLVRALNVASSFLGAAARGRRNALDVRVTRLTIPCVGLPSAYDGYTILHLSDLHLEPLPGLAAVLRRALSGIVVDLAVLTGDYETIHAGETDRAAALAVDALSAAAARDGIYGVLGNHDSHRIVELLEAHGIRMLVNESATIHRDGHPLHLVGVDDVHSFFTDDAIRTLAQPPAGFRVALVHTPDLASLAAEHGYGLYLTGHTHGGQVCLPSGRPMVTMLDSHDHLAAGAWRVGTMAGYTSRGVGAGNVPLRFNCPGEIAVLRLTRAAT
ncbi:MAG: metallophosphoesterase [Rhodospirillales bacterium]|nr:metallophosphoesterase [Rhodospirillales bacterium]